MKSDSTLHRSTPGDDIVQTTQCVERGGYSKPRIFSIACSEWTGIFDFDRVAVDGGCSTDGARTEDWYTCRWDSFGAPDHDGRPALLKLPGITKEMLSMKLGDFPAKMLGENEEVPTKRGIVYVAHDRKTAYCPFTGVPITTWDFGS